MFTKLIICLAILALVVSAGTIPAGKNFKITLMQPSVMKGHDLKAGDYKVTVADAKIIVTPANGKNPVEVPVKIESADKKFDDTVVGYSTVDGKAIISEIRVGGTTTRLLFN